MKTQVSDIRLLIAQMLTLGVEPGAQTLSIKPAKSKMWFAYTGREEDKSAVRACIADYLFSMWQATDIVIVANQYARSRFRYYAEFNTPCAIDPSQYKTEHVDLSKF